MNARATRFLSVLALLSATEVASAYDASVDATFDAQLYQVTSPYGDPILRRRRYTETLALRVRDIGGPHEPGGPELFAVARIRLDSDYGVEEVERSPSTADRFVPGVTNTKLDLMMAYVEGRNYAGGPLGFRLGRQYVIDGLGFWSFDGAQAKVTTPIHLAFEAYGGFEQRGGLFLMSTSRFEADGVFRGDRQGMDPDLWPAYLDESRPAPAYGFAVESAGVSWLTTRLTYRKVQNRDTVVVAPFPELDGAFATEGSTRTSSEKVGWAGTAFADDLGSVRGTFVYDAYAQAPSEYAASVEAYLARTLRAGADFDYFLPTFDGDSIWNWFSHYGTTTLTGHVGWEPARRFALIASGGVRRFEAQDVPSLLDVLASVEGTYRTARTKAGARANDEHGERGHRRGAEVTFARTFGQERYDTSALLSLYDWSDALRTDRDSTAFTYVLGGGLRPYSMCRVGAEWEHTMSRITGHRLRALLTLAVTAF